MPLIQDEAGPNPHLWMDVAYAKLYAGRIADALAAADPAHEAGYRDRAAAYGSTPGRARRVGPRADRVVPEADRKVVTMHDAFPYYARAYGLDVVGVAVGAPAT